MSMNNASYTEDDSTFEGAGTNLRIAESMDYSGLGSYNHTDDGGASSVTGGGGHYLYRHQDATEIVHEMHLALLYLLSNPDEFKKALNAHPPGNATTLEAWNAEIEEEDEESVMTSGVSTALPFIVFADDAEVVLPQAHTASQLFGIEKVEGIELEAAAGIPALSQLFLRWLGEYNPHELNAANLSNVVGYSNLILVVALYSCISLYTRSVDAWWRSLEYNRSSRSYGDEDRWWSISGNSCPPRRLDLDE